MIGDVLACHVCYGQVCYGIVYILAGSHCIPYERNARIIHWGKPPALPREAKSEMDDKLSDDAK